MINRVIGILPFPPVSAYTLEIIRQIKAIPDKDIEIEYTESEIKWMNRAIQNLDYMLTLYTLEEPDREPLVMRRDQIKTTLEAWRRKNQCFVS